MLATTDGEGGVDASPRGDAPGFVAVLDDTTLLLPDRPGNNRVDSYGNIVAHPGVGLLFFVPGHQRDAARQRHRQRRHRAELLTPLQAQDKVPAAGLRIAVREAFFHCAKALMRSHLWDPATQVERKKLSRRWARSSRTRPSAMAVPEAEELVEHGYRTAVPTSLH